MLCDRIESEIARTSTNMEHDFYCCHMTSMHPCRSTMHGDVRPCAATSGLTHRCEVKVCGDEVSALWQIRAIKALQHIPFALSYICQYM
jgi:hypothetical protein